MWGNRWPEIHLRISLLDCKNPKGKPGWGTKSGQQIMLSEGASCLFNKGAPRVDPGRPGPHGLDFVRAGLDRGKSGSTGPGQRHGSESWLVWVFYLSGPGLDLVWSARGHFGKLSGPACVLGRVKKKLPRGTKGTMVPWYHGTSDQT